MPSILKYLIITATCSDAALLQVNDTGAVRAGTYRLVMTGGGGAYCNMNVRGRSAIEVCLLK